MLTVEAYGAIGNGVADDAPAIQAALTAADTGPDRVVLLSKVYRVASPLVIPPDVALVGPRRSRTSHPLGWMVAGQRTIDAVGGCLHIDHGAGNAAGTPAVTLSADSLLEGVGFVWPNQVSAGAPVAYPWAVKLGSGIDACVRHVEFFNAYAGIWGQDHSRPTIQGVTGQCFAVGLFIDACYDVARISDIHWMILQAAPGSEHDQWIRDHCIGFDFGRVDEALLSMCFAYHVQTGFRFRETPSGKPWASMSQCGADVCGVGLDVSANQHSNPPMVPWPILATTCMFTSCDIPVLTTDSSGVRVVNGLPSQESSIQTSLPPSAVYVATNRTTSGSWRGVYGTQGYHIVNVSDALPAWATIVPTDASPWTWQGSTNDTRAPQQPAGANRIASTWYSTGYLTPGLNHFSLALTLSDAVPHRVSLYVLDWETTTRAQTIDILNATTGAVLDSRTINSFHDGAYLTWTMQGTVVIRVTGTAGPNAVVAGVWLDAA